MTATNDYVQQWRSEPSPLDAGDIQAQLDQRSAEIDVLYPRDRLEALVANGGVEPDPDVGPTGTDDGRDR